MLMVSEEDAGMKYHGVIVQHNLFKWIAHTKKKILSAFTLLRLLTFFLLLGSFLKALFFSLFLFFVHTMKVN